MVRGPGAPSGMTEYVSGYSKISASISGASPGKNASIKSYKLVINGVTYNSSSATSDVISKSGTVTVTAQITDSRGRTSTTVTKNVTFTAYKPPSITTFKAARQSTNTTIKVDWAVSYLNITGNSVTTKIDTKQSTASSWSTFQANTTSTSGSKTLTGVSDLVTQQFRLTSTDSFGNSVSRIISVGTAKVAFSIGKNEGIGVGKIWERGALDVQGDVYIEGGDIHVGGTTFLSHLAESAKKHITESGSNENGRYIKFDDGTMICYHSIELGSILAFGTGTFSDLYRTNTATWIYPQRFVGSPIITAGVNHRNITGINRAIGVSSDTPGDDSVHNIQAFRYSGGNQDTNVAVHLIAIGRWK